MKNVRVLPLAVCGILAAMAAPPAAAQDKVFPGERLEPAVDKEGIGSTAWAGVPDTWGWDAALWLGYEKNPVFTFDDAGDTPYARKSLLVEDRFTADAVFALALFNWVQVGLDVPVILSQGSLSTGFGDIAVSPKVRVLRQSDGAPLDVAVLLPFTLPSGQFTDYGGEGGPTITPGIAFSRTFGPLRLAANVGHRFRDVVTIPNLSIGDELIYRAAAAYDFDLAPGRETELGLSLQGAAATDDLFRGNAVEFNAAGAESSAPARNPVELVLEGRTSLWGPFDVFAGGGVGVVAGYGVPDFRVFLGVRTSDRPAYDYDGDGLVGAQDKCPKLAENFNGWEDDDGCPDVGDDDHDGIPNDKDKCPQLPEDKDGFEDDDGCPDDNDHDGVADEDDKCPNAAEDKDGFEDEDGCPDFDNDGDGIPDDKDKCKNEAEDKDGFQDEDGCPDPDNDADGLLDGDDKCPDEAGPKQNGGCPDKDRDSDGVVDRFDNCPDEPGPAENGGCAKTQLVVITEAKLEIKDKVFFDTDKDTIKKKSFPLLDNVAAVLQAHPEIKKVRVEGHTDNVGPDAHNKDLSERRAKSVRKYLIDQGHVDAGRLDAAGYGPDRPIADNATDDGRAQNRRVEFVIVEE